MRSIVLALTFGLMASVAVAADWGKVATISSTLGVSGSRLCVGEASRGDIGCPSYAPSLITTGDVTVGGSVTANSFVGDGSGLTGVTAGSSDRIVSGTGNATSMIAISNTGYISLTQGVGGTNTGWFDPTRGLVTIGVSSTGPISGTGGYFSGKVGIGGVPSANQLTVYGTMSASQQVRAGVLLDVGAGPTFIAAPSNGVFQFMDSNVTSPNAQLQAGSMGLGTVTPTATLQVSGSFMVSGSAQINVPALYVSGSSGYVGMGTITPTSSLYISSSISNVLSLQSGTGQVNLAIKNWLLYSGGTNSIALYNGVDRLNINSAGNVGIGTANQLAQLHVSGSFLVSGSSQIANAALYVSGTSGYVGIGTSAPSATLDVSGSVHISGTVTLANTGSEVCDSAHWYSLRIDPSTQMVQMCRP